MSTQVGQAYYDLSIRLDEVEKGLSAADRKIDAHLREQQAEFQRAAAQIAESMDRAGERIERAMSEAADSAGRSARRMKAQVSAEIAQLEKGIGGSLGRALDASMDIGNTKLMGQLDHLHQKFMGVGMGLSAGLTAPLAIAAKASFDATVSMEGLHQMLATAMGSAQAAGAEFEKLRKVAELPGLDLREAIGFSSVMQNMGKSADYARDLMAQWSNEMARNGKGAQDFGRVLTNLQQLMGTFSGQEIHELVQLVPTLRGELLKLYGTVEGDALKKMGVDGVKVVDDLTKAWATKPRAAFDTLRNEIDNLSQDFEQLKAAAGEVFVPLVRDVISTVRPMMRELTEWFDSLDEGQKRAAASAVLFAGALGPGAFAIGGTIDMVSSLVTAVNTLKIAKLSAAAAATTSSTAIAASGAKAAAAAGPAGFGALIAVLGNPWVLGIGGAVLAVGGLAYALDQLVVTQKEADDASRRALTATIESHKADAKKLEGLAAMVKEYEGLSKIQKPTTEQQQRMTELMGRIVQLNPDLVEGYDKETGALRLVHGALKKVNDERERSLSLSRNLERAAQWDVQFRPLMEERRQLIEKRARLNEPRLSAAERAVLQEQARGGDDAAAAYLREDAMKSSKRDLAIIDGRIAEINRRIREAEAAGKVGNVPLATTVPPQGTTSPGGNGNKGGKSGSGSRGNTGSGSGRIGISKEEEARNWKDELKAAAQQFGMRVTSEFRPGARTRASNSISNHARSIGGVKGLALDIAGTKEQMAELYEWIAKNYKGKIRELIYSPKGQIVGNFYKPPAKMNKKTRADHFDHVHVSLFSGLKGGARRAAALAGDAQWDSQVMEQLRALEEEARRQQQEREALKASARDILDARTRAKAVSGDPVNSGLLRALGFDPESEGTGGLRWLRQGLRSADPETRAEFEQVRQLGFELQRLAAAAEQTKKAVASGAQAVSDYASREAQRKAESEAFGGLLQSLGPEKEASPAQARLDAEMAEYNRAGFRLRGMGQALAVLAASHKREVALAAKLWKEEHDELERSIKAVRLSSWAQELEAEVQAVAGLNERIRQTMIETGQISQRDALIGDYQRGGVSADRAGEFADLQIKSDKAREEYSRMRSLAEDAAGGIADAFAGVLEGRNPFEGLRTWFTQTLADIASEALKSQIFSWLMPMLMPRQAQGLKFLGSPKGLGSLAAGFSGMQFRAAGGPVRAGSPYIVGEQGPELLVPGHPGTILSHEDTRRALGGGGTTVNISIQVAPGQAASDPAYLPRVSKAVEQAVREGLRQARRSGG